MRIGVFRGHSTDARVKATVEAFISGLRHLGADFFVDVEYRPCDVAVIWGISSKRAVEKTRYRDVVRASQPNTIVIERGFVDREWHYSVGWGDTGGLGDYCCRGAPGDRWAKLGVELKPWRAEGETVLLCGQIPHDTSVQHVDYVAWLRSAAGELRKYTKRPVVYRKHPLLSYDIGPIEGAVASSDSLDADLARAHVVVTFNSTVGVESVIAGIPTLSFDRRSMAYPVSAHRFADADAPARPERLAWAHELAYSQWHIDEIAVGAPWLHLRRRFER